MQVCKSRHGNIEIKKTPNYAIIKDSQCDSVTYHFSRNTVTSAIFEFIDVIPVKLKHNITCASHQLDH